MAVEHIKYTDSLRQGTDKINNVIDHVDQQAANAVATANNAMQTAQSAEQTANQALANSEATQHQLDTIVINGDSSVEAAQARVSTPKGITYDVLKDRLDANEQDLITHKADYDQYVGDIASLGIGVGVIPRVSTDLNNEFDSGWVRIDFGTTQNAPPVGFAWGVCRIDRRNASAVYQTAYRTDGAGVRIFSRKYNAGTWSDWVEIITDAAIMTGSGSPQGAVTATPGTIYRRTDSTGELWVKVSGSGNTGWGKVTVS